MQLFINQLGYTHDNVLLYMHQFVEAGNRAGLMSLRQKQSRRHLFRRIAPLCLSLFNALRLHKFRSKVLITTSRGDGILEAAYPHYLHYQIIPMLWDTWPKEQPRLFHDLRMLKCPLVLVSSRQMAERIQTELCIKSLWVPEGIDPKGFLCGKNLADRSIDIYELGRQHPLYHKELIEAKKQSLLKTWKGNTYGTDGRLLKLACKTTDELKATISESKIVVCFPKTDTDPEGSGKIETLTQRYWEAMLSRSLILGRAPQELIDFIGYNPVIEVNWNAPQRQIAEILHDISSYQSLVERNYDTACQKASWDGRMEKIREFIEKGLLS